MTELPPASRRHHARAIRELAGRGQAVGQVSCGSKTTFLSCRGAVEQNHLCAVPAAGSVMTDHAHARLGTDQAGRAELGTDRVAERRRTAVRTSQSTVESAACLSTVTRSACPTHQGRELSWTRRSASVSTGSGGRDLWDTPVVGSPTANRRQLPDVSAETSDAKKTALRTP
jgi:hypothetical protein